MISVLLRTANGSLKLGGQELCPAGPPELEGSVVWVDILDQSPEELKWLQEGFKFHPLTIEDCAHLDQRPKIDEYEGYLFVVVHGFTAPPYDATDLELHEVHCFLGAHYIVTVHQSEIPVFHAVRRRFSEDSSLLARGPDYALYAVCDSLIDAQFPLLDGLKEEIEHLEERIIEDMRGTKKELKRIFSLRAALTTMRKVLSPQRDVVGSLARRDTTLIKKDVAVFFRDAYDHLNRIYEGIDSDRELLGNTMDAYLSMVSQRTNEVMKRLAVVSLIFLPLGVLTGFFGMNFEHFLPFASASAFNIVVAATLLLPVVLVAFFAYKRWL